MITTCYAARGLLVGVESCKSRLPWRAATHSIHANSYRLSDKRETCLTRKPTDYLRNILSSRCAMRRDLIAGKVGLASEGLVSSFVDGKHSVEGRRLVGAILSRQSFTPRGNVFAKAGGMQFTLSQFGVEIQDQLMAIRHGRGEMGRSTAHRASSRGRGPFKASESQGPFYFVSTQESNNWFEKRSLSGWQISVAIT